MRRILFILFFIPVLCSAQPVTDGLVGYWPFNGNANDESGNGHDGNVTGATLSTDRFGNANSAYLFDGNDYITLFDAFGLDQWTVSAWINPIVPIPETSPYYNIMTIMSGDSLTKFLGIKNGCLSMYYVPTVEYDFTNNVDWHHVIFSYDGQNLTGYVDLNTINSIQVENPISEDKVRVFGVRNTLNGHHSFNGRIDDIQIYDRVLSFSEISQLYNDMTYSKPILCNQVYCDEENIGIGTDNTRGYKLAVAGDILCEKIKVATQENWPDFVFEGEYNLLDVKQLEKFIKENQHLPNIPSADSIENSGYNLSEMDAKLLQKIEELTLYIIEQNKQNEALLERVEQLEKKLNTNN